MRTRTHIDDVLELAALTGGRHLHDAIRSAIPPAHPRNDGEEGGEGGSGGDGGSGSGGGSGDGGGGQGGAGGEGGGSGGEGGEESHTLTKAEWDNLQRQLRESTTTAQKLQKEKEERERKDAEARGEHEKLAQQERERAEKAERELAQERNERRVTTIATRLRFRDPTDVIGRLSDADLTDEASIERKLKAIAKEKPYLVTDAEKPRQRDIGNGDGGGGDQAIAGTSRMARAYGSGSKT